ncbi:MAG: hypothetical protein ABIB93_06455 [Chloroflexota bacterium]
MPGIQITAPKYDLTYPIGDVTVFVKAVNFNLADKQGKANIPGQGHIHYFMDVEPPVVPGEPAVTENGTYVATAATSYTWKDVKAGDHIFSVELVNNDHTPLDPPVTFNSAVKISDIKTPIISIISPADEFFQPAGDIRIAVEVYNFVLAEGEDAVEDIPGLGHVHYYMDSQIPVAPGVPAHTANVGMPFETAFTWKDVKPGYHTFSVALANYDHTPLVPPVIDQIELMVVE